MSYRITPLPLAPFTGLFGFDDEALRARGARRIVAESANSAPCRVSLRDAEPGERLILASWTHLADPASPYRAGGPVFVRENAVEAAPVFDDVPPMLGRRLLSARAYDAHWMMLDADVVDGADLDARLRLWLADPEIRTVHLHTARRGCYMAAATAAP